MQTAQCVLDARAQFAGASSADLYDPHTMQLALLKSHKELDAAYQPRGGKNYYASDAERVTFVLSCIRESPACCMSHAAKNKRKSKSTEDQKK